MPGRISEEYLEQLRNNNDIVSVISPYVSLRKRGRTYVGLCPFHNEKTPSFTVYPDSQSFYCFGCGAGGEIISFTRKIENIDFAEAVKSLAEKANMPLPADNFNDSLSEKRKRIYDMNREAAKFFHEQLYTPEGKKALDYYYSRGYTPATVKHFGLGYAPDSWDKLLKHLRSQNYSFEEIFEANLARKKTNDGGKTSYYDNFRNRAMVPIIDVRGRVTAFGGRVFDDSKPKYINTSDTLVYKKSLGVFALNFAKNGNEGSLILCEGYMDVIALHQAGFTNAVAALGTAFTEEMARLLSRYSQEIILCFDNDEAGKEATERALRVFSTAGVRVKVIKMTGGKDPDEILKKFGAEKFRSFLSGAANNIEYKLLEEREKHDMESSDGKLSFLKKATEILSQSSDPIARDVYAGKLSQELSVNKDVILSRVNSHIRSKRREKSNSDFRDIQKKTSGAADKVNTQKKDRLRAANAEEALISSLMRNPDFYKKIKESITKEDFLTDFNRRLFSLIAEKAEDGQNVTLTALSPFLTVEEMGALKEIEMKSEGLKNTAEECESFIRVIKEEGKKLKMFSVPASDMTDEEFLAAIKNLKK